MASPGWRVFGFFVVLLFGLSPLVYANSENVKSNTQGWVVLVSINADIETLTKKQVMSLFLGRSRFLPGGTKVTALDHPLDSEIRADFYHALTGKNISDIDAYWARLKYSGKASPPLPVENAEQIIEILSRENGIIAYLPSSYRDYLAERGINPVLTM